MEWLFGRKKTPDEMLRQNQRALTKAMRELDRERSKMEQQEKKIIADIKKMAKQGQMDAVKIMAKVRLFMIIFVYDSKSQERKCNGEDFSSICNQDFVITNLMLIYSIVILD